MRPLPVQSSGRALVGCSGWMYRDWRGSVYPEGSPPAQWLGAYADRFPTVEINSTFYRLPEPSTVLRWASSVPPDFVFASKLGSFGSHRKKLSEPTTWLPRHLERIRLLGPHRGPCLVQLPGRWRLNLDRLGEFLAAVPHDVRWALEVRDPTWLHDDVLALLERHGVALCVHDLLPDQPQVVTTDWTYVRFHGPNALSRPYHGAYGARRLQRRANWMRRLLDDGNDVYAYFNNDWGAAAVGDAELLRSMLARSGHAVV